MQSSEESVSETSYSPAEMGALAHLYRGEMFRSKIWRTRLDTTTNWAVGTTGIALSITFSDPDISALPLILVGLLVIVFLGIEARRYRYFDIWRTRVRLMEVCFFRPVLLQKPLTKGLEWKEALARDYTSVHFHISFWEAAGRRLRRNYGWIFIILGVSYLGKLAIHPSPITEFSQIWNRASIGTLGGQVVVIIGLGYYLALLLLAVLTLRKQQAAGRVSGPADQDPIRRFGMDV